MFVIGNLPNPGTTEMVLMKLGILNFENLLFISIFPRDRDFRILILIFDSRIYLY